MPKCCFKKCKNITSRTLKKDGISYFRFPRDPMRSEEWKSVVGRQRCEDFFQPNNSSVVCSDHFAESDIYVTEKGIKRILKTAVPINDIEIPVVIEINPMSLCLSEASQAPPKSPTPSLRMTSKLNRPPKVVIKSEVTQFHKKLIKRDKLISNLRKRNYRLAKRNDILKSALKVLKEKINLDKNLCHNCLSKANDVYLLSMIT